MPTLSRVLIVLSLLATPLAAQEDLGYLSTNPYLTGSVAAPGAEYDPLSPANPFSPYGSAYSPDGARNRYTTGGPLVIDSDGTYLGRLNANRFDPESVSNPYGKYGSPYSAESVNNPYGQYGSSYAPTSARDPYAWDPPRLLAPDRSRRSLRLLRYRR